MKKIISIILTVMMVAALSVAVFAEQPANGLYVEAIDDGNGIVALNVYAVGAIDKMTLGQVAINYPTTGVTPVKPDKTTSITANVTSGVADYYTLADGFTSWTSGSIKLKTVSSKNYVSYNITTADAVNVTYSQDSGKTLLFTAYMAYTVAVDDSSFAISSLTGMNASLTTKISVSSGTTAIKDNAAMFALDFKAATPITPDEPDEEVFGIVKTETAVAGTDTMKDENGADVAAAGDKVVAIFAKNVTDAELEAGSYGIVFGGVRYAGQLAVPAKTAWAIKLVGSAEQLPAGKYAYGVFAGDATVDATTPWEID